MQKRKFFTIFAILIIIPLIGLSAQCGANTEDKKDVSQDEKGLDEAPTGNEEVVKVGIVPSGSDAVTPNDKAEFSVIL